MTTTNHQVTDQGNQEIPEGYAQDITINEVKALFPEMTQGPIINSVGDSSNPGIRLIQNDDNLLDMLKIVYVEDYDEACYISEALAECDEFLLKTDGKPHPLVLQRIEWIKYRLALFCSIKGRFADAYKQASTGVLTNAMSERGWNLLSMPIGRANMNNSRESKGKRP